MRLRSGLLFKAQFNLVPGKMKKFPIFVISPFRVLILSSEEPNIANSSSTKNQISSIFNGFDIDHGDADVDADVVRTRTGDQALPDGGRAQESEARYLPSLEALDL